MLVEIGASGKGKYKLPNPGTLGDCEAYYLYLGDIVPIVQANCADHGLVYPGGLGKTQGRIAMLKMQNADAGVTKNYAV